ncbi:interleukin-17 receptor A-like [Brachionichthys hirsutus]|uniref:interleukin-17 receptor A-like n=1 Tax=Brachionichthys hirsutus TaxID=412623 RepID=UPI003604F244
MALTVPVPVPVPVPVLVPVLVLMWVSGSSTVRILSWPPLSCSQEGLVCAVNTSNCVDSRWLDINKYTPSSPEALRASVDTRHDERGRLQPVLVASWQIKDDGSISYLNATELHVLVVSTNQHLCVRYSFKDKFQTMRSPSGDKWSFSAAMVVLDPGQMYQVSVFNIPKPELGHSSYDVSIDVTVAGCEDVTMLRTQFCIERGSLWQPAVSLAQVSAAAGGSALAVGFRPDRLCEEYIVIVTCVAIQQVNRARKANQTALSVIFNLEQWPRSCCQFDVEIKPLFPECGQDCTRRRSTLDICPVTPTDAPDAPVSTFLIVGGLFLCGVTAVIVYVCRKPGRPGVSAAPGGREETRQRPLRQTPTVLVIYSQDHHLYRDIVLKLCAFLQLQCGIKVLVDLLDSTSVGVVGRLRWLEWQRQQLKNPSDKILVLCSRGVQAKWRAMCGQGRVTLREDVLSPTDDMLTPFLNLFLPDLQQAGTLGKYMVAYFDDISGEQAVPSVFDIAVKYKLMKHFEELYFRVLDVEKYQPGQVNHVEGIGGDEYFDCPSGAALRDAIETFRVYQVENPDWFEKECVDDEEEEVGTEADCLIEQLQIPPVLECVPLIREGPPVYVHEVEVNSANSVFILTPELNAERQLPSVAELTPVVNPERRREGRDPSLESVLVLEPLMVDRPARRQSRLSEEEAFRQTPAEDDEDASLPPVSRLAPSEPRISRLQNRPDPDRPGCSSAGEQSGSYPPPAISQDRPPALEDLEPAEKAPSNDQGYMSKMSSQNDEPHKEDPLLALRRLQEQLLHRNLIHGTAPEGN